MKSVLISRYKPYLFLAPLFALALFYQLTYTAMVIRLADDNRNIDLPIYSTDGKLADVSERAEKAGLHRGDKVFSIDGHSIKGERDFFRSFHTQGVHAPLNVEVIPKGKTTPALHRVPAFKPKSSPMSLMDEILAGVLVFVMLFCVVIGIYPALMLPRDARALIFFSLMVGTGQVVKSAQWFDFPQPLQFFAFILQIVAEISWPIWLICFALYFPRRFEWDRRRPRLKWILLGPLVALACLIVTTASLNFFSYQLSDALWNATHLPHMSWGWTMALAVIALFTSVITKLHTSKTHDGRRRLKILLAGSAVGLLPLGALVAYQSLPKWSVFHRVPDSVVLPVCLLFCLFPITLAYVIVAERAMELRMVIRQGVRYTLAKAGLRVVTALALAGILYAVGNSVTEPEWIHSSPYRVEIKTILYGLIVWAGVLLMRRMRERLTVGLDKRFFREAYNSELILAELSDSVRSMVDEEEMLGTVAQRVSESLHVSHFAFLLEENGRYRPVYCLGFEPTHEIALAENAKALDVVRTATTPAPIYFDREDNWVFETPKAEVSTLQSLHTQLLLPLGRKDKLLGVISLGPKRSEEPYSRTDLQLLSSVALQTSFALENSRLTKTVATEMAQREKLNREIEIAREVQERLFPQRLPPLAGIDYFGACRPALGVGGDYYDFLALANGELGVAIGDVSGKGIAAALLMASLQASLRGQALVGQADLAQLMRNVNQLVYDATPVNRYATFFYGQYNRATGLFRYVNAGHNPPVILRAGYNGSAPRSSAQDGLTQDGLAQNSLTQNESVQNELTQNELAQNGSADIIRLEAGGPVVGLFPGVPYQEGSLTLKPGDIFIGFTDGISEAMNNEEEEWGEERLIPAAVACGAKPAAEMIPLLMADADRFAAGAPQHDDMTLVIVKMNDVPVNGAGKLPLQL